MLQDNAIRPSNVVTERGLAVSLRHIVKHYPAVIALNDVSMSFMKGEVHAIVGENGAGKSTFIGVLSGAVAADAGEIEIDGDVIEHMTPHLSHAHGIEVIYQHLMLTSGLSVAENIFLGKKIGRFVNRKLLSHKAKAIFEEMGVSIDPSAMINELTVAEQQMVEIAKALSSDAKIIVMDEPTAPLSVHEVDALMAIIKKLRAKGITVIYISHRMEEIFSISDRISVMRDGMYIGTLDTAKTSRSELIQMMVGRELAEDYPARSNITDAPMLELRRMSGNGVLDVDLVVRKGEIVGLGGLVGAGRTELAELIFGLGKKTGGELLIDGVPVNIASPQQALCNGIGLIPEDRKKNGCFLVQGIDWNISIANIRAISRLMVVNRKTEQKQAELYRQMLNIKTPYISQKVMNLSGGNQQKVVLAKTLACDCDIILFDEPTKGIDVGAKQEIYHLMTRLADEGKAILMISSDMNELLGMSDRIYVLHEGRVARELQKGEFSQVSVLEAASGK